MTDDAGDDDLLLDEELAHLDLVSPPVAVDVAADLASRIEAFTAELAALGVHYGLAVDGDPVVCPTCGETWPCPDSIEAS